MFLNFRWHKLHSTGFCSSFWAFAVVVTTLTVDSTFIVSPLLIVVFVWFCCSCVCVRTNECVREKVFRIISANDWVDGTGRHLFTFCTCMFHVLGLCICFCPLTVVVTLDRPAALAFVCCIIWLMRSSCWRVRPSLPEPAGRQGDVDFEPSPDVPPFPLNWIVQFEPCGELASPAMHGGNERPIKNTHPKHQQQIRSN